MEKERSRRRRYRRFRRERFTRSHLAYEVVKPLVAGTGRLTFALDDTPTERYGPKVQGAGVHHNPTPGPADGAYAKAPFLKPMRALEVTVVSRLRKDSALWTVPGPRVPHRRGPNRIYGEQRIDLAK